MITKGKKALGELGEQLSCDFLVANGHRILERNWRSGHLEIDIISEDGNGVLVHSVVVGALMSGNQVLVY